MSDQQYHALQDVLNRARWQAENGKGKERHANDLPFEHQPMQTTAQLHGIGFITGQVTKKLQEAQGMLLRGDQDKAIHEMLGAIVYAAGAVVFAEREGKSDGPDPLE